MISPLVTDSFHRDRDSRRDSTGRATNGVTERDITVEEDAESTDSGPLMTCKVRLDRVVDCLMRQKPVKQYDTTIIQTFPQAGQLSWTSPLPPPTPRPAVG